jgi:hypothetical protein
VDAAQPSDKDAEKVAEFGADVPMQRPAQPEELSPLYVFLASPVCSQLHHGRDLPGRRRLQAVPEHALGLAIVHRASTRRPDRRVDASFSHHFK